MLEKTVKDDPGKEKTYSGKPSSKKYTPLDSERGLVHVELEKICYSSRGVKLSSPFIQKMSVKEWNMFKKGNEGLGYDVSVLWHPDENGSQKQKTNK
jgi:hypothetical protein